MQKRWLIPDILEVSVLSFGGAAVSGEGAGYGFGNISEDDSIGLVQQAYDRGINLFDSAPIYGFGLSEKRIGKALKQKRDKVCLVSKSGVTWHENKRVDMSNDPKVTQKMLEQSLRDFDTDYIDLYMIHWPDEKVDIRKPMEVLAKAKLEGKIKHIGLCNTHKEDLEKADEVDKVEVLQSEFSFSVDQNKTLFDEGIGFMSWGTLDKGVLTGTVGLDQEYGENDCRKGSPWWKRSAVNAKVKRMQKVFDYLKGQGVSGLELALGHNLLHDQVKTLLVGMRKPKYLDDAIKALENLPSEEIILKAKQIWNQ